MTEEIAKIKKNLKSFYSDVVVQSYYFTIDTVSKISEYSHTFRIICN